MRTGAPFESRLSHQLESVPRAPLLSSWSNAGLQSQHEGLSIKPRVSNLLFQPSKILSSSGINPIIMNGNGVRNEPKRTMSDYHLHSTPGMHLSYSMAPPPSSNSHGQHIVRRDSHRSNTRNRISLSRRVSMVTTEGNLVTGNIAGDTLKISQPRKKLILCFDGTGNKFKGNSGDTNILKIFRMLDRSGGEKCTNSSLQRYEENMLTRD